LNFFQLNHIEVQYMYVFITEMYYKKSEKDLLFEYSANLNLIYFFFKPVRADFK